jgi:hypothetical protein
MPIRIANAAGFLGDSLSAPRQLLEAAEVDYLTLEYLAELTMSILARSREKNPERGYAGDFIDVLSDISEFLQSRSQLKIVTNAGGVNPEACATAASRVLCDAGLGNQQVAIVSGDDLLPDLERLQKSGHTFENLETGEALGERRKDIVSANAYLGAEPICEALQQNARIVITGRVADAALAVGPAMYEYNWTSNDLTQLAGASVAGHLIECGAQVTGGYATTWKDLDLADVGYPIVELDNDGSGVITKPAGSGGVVNLRTVTEQLVYEIGDPQHYLTPDVDVDFTTVELEEVGTDRVRYQGAVAHGSPDMYKATLAMRDGFMAAGQLLVFGKDCRDKAQACAEMIFARLRRVGLDPARHQIELLGTGASMHRDDDRELQEVVLRVAVHDTRREVVEHFSREIAPLITSGPAGLAGYAAGRVAVRPVYSHWPTLIPKSEVRPRVTLRTAVEWSS